MQSLGISRMKVAILNKLEEVQKESYVKYPKRQVRLIEVPPNKMKNRWISRVQKQKENEDRLMPNLNPLYKKILSFDFSVPSEIPSESLYHYKTIPNTFSSAKHYVQIFEPLLMLECWHYLCDSKEKVNDNDKIIIFVEDICMVDDFIEVSFICEEHDLGRLSENDLLDIRYEPSEKDFAQYYIPLIRSMAIIKNKKLLFYLNEISQNVRRFLFKGSRWHAHRIAR